MLMRCSPEMWSTLYKRASMKGNAASILTQSCSCNLSMRDVKFWMEACFPIGWLPSPTCLVSGLHEIFLIVSIVSASCRFLLRFISLFPCSKKNLAFFIIFVRRAVCWNTRSFVQACGLHCEQLAHMRLDRAVLPLAAGQVMLSRVLRGLELWHNTRQHVGQTRVFFLKNELLCKHFVTVIAGHPRAMSSTRSTVILSSKHGPHVPIPHLVLPCAVLACFFCYLI
uniref:Uncharacterized protein n=1 Tax=Rhipicephalus zambeziensis TaxID=60191 RepID=A0A224Y567_9ACAR